MNGQSHRRILGEMPDQTCVLVDCAAVKFDNEEASRPSVFKGVRTYLAVLSPPGSGGHGARDNQLKAGQSAAPFFPQARIKHRVAFTATKERITREKRVNDSLGVAIIVFEADWRFFP